MITIYMVKVNESIIQDNHTLIIEISATFTKLPIPHVIFLLHEKYVFSNPVYHLCYTPISHILIIYS